MDNWYAIRVKSNREKVVNQALEGKGFESYLPLYKVRSRWSDRIKDLELPLFSSYVFCRLDAAARLPILTIPGVVLFVSIGRTPAPIEDEEIEALKTVCRSGLPTAPWPFLQKGQQVRIEKGPLKDVCGILVEAKNDYRLVVSVTMLQRSVAVEIDRDSVCPVASAPKHPQSATSRIHDLKVLAASN